ncbi:MAG TPA: hypothetical protein V6C97_06305 [Oculatellaceae cyanobacterium]
MTVMRKSRNRHAPQAGVTIQPVTQHTSQQQVSTTASSNRLHDAINQLQQQPQQQQQQQQHNAMTTATQCNMKKDLVEGHVGANAASTHPCLALPNRFLSLHRPEGPNIFIIKLLHEPTHDLVKEFA